MAERPLNQCRRCLDTWHSRGRDLSNRCPRCSSTEVVFYHYPATPLTSPSLPSSSGGGGGSLLVVLLVVVCVGVAAMALVCGGVFMGLVAPDARQVAKAPPAIPPAEAQRQPLTRPQPDPGPLASKPQPELDLSPRPARQTPVVVPEATPAFEVAPPLREVIPTGPKGTVVLIASSPLAASVRSWVEVDGERVADWKTGLKQIELRAYPGDRRVVVQAEVKGVIRVVYDDLVRVAAGERTAVLVARKR